MEPTDRRQAASRGRWHLDETVRKGWARELREALGAVLDAWFPRVIDREHGGFLCDFDHRWRPTGPHWKMLEFQARQTRVAAATAAFFPDRADLRAAAEHGFAYLRDVMWDAEYGGFYRMLDRSGSPLEAQTKHGHGTAYALQACVAHHRLTGSEESLNLAKRCFDWMERHAHDDRHGGYFGYYRRDGRLILEKADSPAEYPVRDPLGTPLGLKDTNTTADLMGTLADLCAAWSDERALERLVEIIDIVRKRVVAPPGSCHMYFQPDWTPVPDFAVYGHNLHTASLLLCATAPLGAEAQGKAEATARTLLDCALEYAWDPGTGGFAYAGSTFGPAYFKDQVIFLGTKHWWPQAEALIALVYFAMKDADRAPVYAEKASVLWDYIRTYLVDTRYGGWRWIGLDAGRRVRKMPKADVWKDPSHECMALLKCIRILEAGG